MLLHIDGLTYEWNGELGKFDINDSTNVPFSLQRLNHTWKMRNYDTYGMGRGITIYECEKLKEPEESEIMYTLYTLYNNHH